MTALHAEMPGMGRVGLAAHRNSGVHGRCGDRGQSQDGWLSALDFLKKNVDERGATAERAQKRLQQQYTIARVREQVLDVIVRLRTRVEEHCHRRGQDQETHACLTI